MGWRNRGGIAGRCTLLALAACRNVGGILGPKAWRLPPFAWGMISAALWMRLRDAVRSLLPLLPPGAPSSSPLVASRTTTVVRAMASRPMQSLVAELRRCLPRGPWWAAAWKGDLRWKLCRRAERSPILGGPAQAAAVHAAWRPCSQEGTGAGAWCCKLEGAAIGAHAMRKAVVCGAAPQFDRPGP
jgi:hypothetical protein